MQDRVRVPAEQLYWACSCERYMSQKPGNMLGVSSHIRKSHCGGSPVAVLPEDFVTQEEMDPLADWGPDVPLAETVPDEPTPTGRSEPARRGPVADGKVVPAEEGGPTRFRGAATAPASLYAAYDALRTQAGLEGTFDAWLVECTSLYLEGLGFDLRLVQEVA